MSSMVLHGTWLPAAETFFVWAERVTPLPRRGRRAAIPLHPFHAPPDAWLPMLGTSETVLPQTAVVWLPSTPDAPHPSPELLAMGAAPPADPPTLTAWQVPGVRLPLPQAQTLLLALPQTALLTPGGDLRAWRVTVRLGLALLASQQIAPTLVQEAGSVRAVWRPAPTAAQATVISQLAAALPPLCRAVVNDPTSAPPSRDLIDGFLAALVDMTMREVGTTLTWLAHPAGSVFTALIGTDARVPARGSATQLVAQWQQWAGTASPATTESFRLTFRLEAPDQPDQPWPLAYLLQATDDPSLLVPAQAIWQERGAVLTYLTRRFEQPQERLLAGLGRAARCSPPIRQSLQQATPTQALLTAQDALTFLTETAPALEAQGFGVLVPAWWGTKAPRLTARVRAQSSAPATSTGILAMDRLVTVDWEVLLGDTPLTQREFARIVALKQPLVQLRGQWVVLDSATIQQAESFFAHEARQLTLSETMRLHLMGTLPDSSAPPVTSIVATDPWLHAVLATLDTPTVLTLRDPPPGLHATLRPYQAYGYAWLTFLAQCGLGACLADDMGLGKTVQTIAFLLAVRTQDPDAPPALVVCPTSVVGNWYHELQTFAPALRVLVHRGPDRLRGAAWTAAVQAADVVVTSYPLLARDQALLQVLTWSTVVLDEAQQIKTPETRQAQAARALTAHTRIALTGTPVENRLRDVWSILTFLNPGYLGSQASFQRTFARPIEQLGDPLATDTLRRLTSPLILRRLKTDPTVVTDLPAKIETMVACPLTTEQATLYAAVVEEALAAIAEAEASESTMQRRGLVLALLMRLKQICNHPALFLQDGSPLGTRSGKLARVTELVDEIAASGERTLLFTQFASFGHMLQPYFQEALGEEVLFLHGGTPAAARDQLVRRFQAPAGPKLFLLSLKAGGTGLNLTAASHVVHLDRWWNPAVEQQATDRAYRIGQQRTVQVHTCRCDGTLEDQIDQLLVHKRALADTALGSGEGWLTELDTAQLRDLVTLRTTLMQEEA